MYVPFVCCVSSGLCDELTTRSEKCYQLYLCLIVCGLEMSTVRCPRPDFVCWPQNKNVLQKFSFLLQNPQFQNRVHKSLPLISVRLHWTKRNSSTFILCNISPQEAAARTEQKGKTKTPRVTLIFYKSVVFAFKTSFKHVYRRKQRTDLQTSHARLKE